MALGVDEASQAYERAMRNTVAAAQPADPCIPKSANDSGYASDKSYKSNSNYRTANCYD
jgi:hypothetical protein